MLLRLSGLMAAIGCSSALLANPAPPLRPIDSWHLDYGDTQCSATRQFQAASGPVTLGLAPTTSGDSYRLLISVPRRGPAYAQRAMGTIDWGKGQSRVAGLYFGAKAVPVGVYQYRLSAADIEQARTASAVVIDADGSQSYQFALSDMAPLLAGLADCTQALQQQWNLRGDAALNRPAAPVNDVNSLVGQVDDRWDRSLRHPLSSARFQLLVDPRGRVDGCDVSMSSGDALVDAGACEALRDHARFTPATDRRGQPTRSVWTSNPVSWSLASNTFDGGCTKMSSDGRAILNGCERPIIRGLQQMPPPPPASPPPPPSSKS
ncbi:energy transducer TonB [Sphingomonas sp. ASV193]|uniref:energy transducer TonB n=1 Tax=Sphingomonas sp. ASV193 TaxID=3144405 RepID=UPI0032E8B51B